MTTVAPPTSFEALRQRIDGDVTLPRDPGWDVARAAWNLAVDQRPAAIVEPKHVEDVVAVVQFAREHDLRIAVQSTGHAASAVVGLEEAILVRTHRLRNVQIDAARRRARAQAGAIWRDVAGPAAKHGLAALAGSSADVGVAGYALGGGIGWLARKYGLASNSIRSIELVNAEGQVVVCDPELEPALFWALCGSGGNLGVVTAIELELFPVSTVYAGSLMYPWERSREVLGLWRELIRDVPDTTTSIGRILQIPTAEGIPAPLRDRQFVIIEAAHLGDEATAATLLDPLRALGPEFDTFTTMRPDELSAVHMDPTNPTPMAGDGWLLDDLPAGAIEALIAAAGPGSGSTLQTVEVRHLGGALARTPHAAGALAELHGTFAMFAAGVTPDANAIDKTERAVDRIKTAMHAWDAGHRYLNFAERPSSTAAGFPPDTYTRLRQAKTLADPTDLFLTAHPIQPL